jgi:hypothetical protein
MSRLPLAQFADGVLFADPDEGELQVDGLTAEESEGVRKAFAGFRDARRYGPDAVATAIADVRIVAPTLDPEIVGGLLTSFAAAKVMNYAH